MNQREINGSCEGNEGKWKCFIWYAVWLIIYFIALFFAICGGTMMTSCTTKKIAVNDSVVKVVHDSISNTVYKTEYKDRFIDHYINNMYVVTENGDTVKEKVYERITDASNTFLKDSINILQSKVDSLSHVKMKEVIKTESIGFFDRLKINTFWILVIALLIISAIVIYQNRDFFIDVFKMIV